MTFSFTLTAALGAFAISIGLALPAKGVTVETARQLAHDGDIEGLEAAYSALGRNVEAGRSQQDAQRIAYVAFSTTDPVVHRAVAAWRDTYPNSIYAQTAEIWMNYTIAWHVRGARLGRDTHPQAHREFLLLLQLAQSAALDIYDRAPAFLPASDALLRTAMVIDPPRPVTDYLAEIMELVPNYGSVSRALHSTAPNWGGRWRDLVRICETYAEQVPDMGGYDPIACKIDGGLNYSHDQRRVAKLARKLGPFDSEVLEQWRLHDALYLRPDRENADAVARAEVEKDSFTDARMAMQYDDRFADPNGWPRMGGIVRERAYNEARENLETDPYNPSLVALLREEMEYDMMRGAPTDMSLRLDLAARGIMFDRYSPDAWSNLVHMFSIERDYSDPFRAAPFAQNAAAYSNHNPRYVRLLVDYWFALLHERELVRDPPSEIDVTSAYFQSARAAYDSIGDGELLCPFIRAQRVLEWSCLNNADPAFCREAPEQGVVFGGLFAQAEDQGLCSIELWNPVEELLYTPVEVDITPALRSAQ